MRESEIRGGDGRRPMRRTRLSVGTNERRRWSPACPASVVSIVHDQMVRVHRVHGEKIASSSENIYVHRSSTNRRELVNREQANRVALLWSTAAAAQRSEVFVLCIRVNVYRRRHEVICQSMFCAHQDDEGEVDADGEVRHGEHVGGGQLDKL